MAYPILAPQNTWFKDKCSQSPTYFTEIEIMDSYIPEGTVESWDASAAGDGSIMCYVVGTNLIIAGNGSGKIEMNEDSSKFFMPTSSNPFITRNDIFKNVTKIIGLDLLCTANVKNLSFLFAGLYKVESIDLSSWELSNAENFTSLFAFAGIKEINITGWNTPKATNINSIFYCDSAKMSNTSYTGIERIIGIEEWELPNISSCRQAFAGCENIVSLNLTKWNVENITSFQAIFANMKKLKTLDISNWKPKSHINNIYRLFDGCESLEEIDLSIFNFTSEGDNFITEQAFRNCSSVRRIILPSYFVFGKNSGHMFESCSSLQSLNTSDWNTSFCENMSFMFYGCSSLKEIDVSKWDVSKVTTFDHFAAHANLRRKGIENWNTSSCENMNAMFHNCAEEELDLSGFDTSKVKYFSQMFENSPNLKHIKGLDKWDTSSATGFDEMFGRCPKLEELDLSSWDTTKAKNGDSASSNGHTTGTFRNFCNDCVNLKWIKLGENFSINGDGTNTTEEYRLILPTSTLEGADGNWYVINGDAYAPNAVQDRTAATYYATYDMVANMDVICKNGSLIEIAKAIREKNGTTDKYTLSQMADAIYSLS